MPLWLWLVILIVAVSISFAMRVRQKRNDADLLDRRKAELDAKQRESGQG